MAETWTLTFSADGSRLNIVFTGRLSEEEGARSAEAFRKALSEAPRHVVWDLTAMSGYDAAARDNWAKAVWPVRSFIKSLTVVGARGLIRVGATFLAVLLGIPHEMRDVSPGAEAP